LSEIEFISESSKIVRHFKYEIDFVQKNAEMLMQKILKCKFAELVNNKLKYIKEHSGYRDNITKICAKEIEYTMDKMTKYENEFIWMLKHHDANLPKVRWGKQDYDGEMRAYYKTLKEKAENIILLNKGEIDYLYKIVNITNKVQYYWAQDQVKLKNNQLEGTIKDIQACLIEFDKRIQYFTR
jgi:hypothetical protein